MPSIHVKNFQSIKDASIEVKGFTALTGPNNSGKSALMRAIRGVFENSPGTSFVRHGEKELEVVVKFEDASVSWSKGTGNRSKPTYIVNGGDPINPGREVPDEVKALGVTPIEAGGKDTWPTLAPQFTGQVFLLDRPGSHLAEAVADIERVSQLNAALRQSDKEKRAASTELKVRRSDLQKAEEGLAAYAGLDGVLSDIEGLGETRQYAEKIGKTHQKLSEMRGRLHDAREVEQALAPVGQVVIPGVLGAQERLAELVMAEGLRDRLEAAREALRALVGVESVVVPTTDASGILDELEGAEKLRGRYHKAADVASRLRLLGEVPDISLDVSLADKLLKAIDKVEGYSYRIGKANQDAQDAAQKLAVSELEYAAAAAEAHQFLDELGACPTCGKEQGA